MHILSWLIWGESPALLLLLDLPWYCSIFLEQIFCTVFLHSGGMATMLCCTFSILSLVFSCSNCSICRLRSRLWASLSFSMPWTSMRACASLFKFLYNIFFIQRIVIIMQLSLHLKLTVHSPPPGFTYSARSPTPAKGSAAPPNAQIHF